MIRDLYAVVWSTNLAPVTPEAPAQLWKPLRLTKCGKVQRASFHREGYLQPPMIVH